MRKSHSLFVLSFVVFASLTLFSGCVDNSSRRAVTLAVVQTPEQAVEALKAGNHRFVVDSLLYPNSDMKRVKETTSKQRPFVAIISCSDSRVPVELIFDQGIGDIFVVRTAGNSVNGDLTMGSVDYAVCHLDVKLVVVLGHTSCGGVAGAITSAISDDPHCRDDGKVGALLEILQKDVEQFVGSPDRINEAISANVFAQVEKLTSNPATSQRIASGQIKVVSAIYDINTGEVEFL